MSWPGQRPSLETFVAEGSWLIFDLFEVKGKPEWLLIPSQHWAKFEEYRKIKEFADHLPVTNDSAERGIALIKACIEKVSDWWKWETRLDSNSGKLPKQNYQVKQRCP